MNIAQLLREQAEIRPDQPAIIDTRRGQPRVTTFGELEQAAARGAALLAEREGLQVGDAVLVFYPMSAELYAALLALFRRGLVAMFLDPSAGREHIERCCALLAPRAFIASPRAHLLRLLSPAVRAIEHKFVIGMSLPGAVSWSRATGLAPRPEIRTLDPATPALITFTSGSTGQPKAAVRSHGFLLAQHRALADSLHLVPGTVDLTTLPIVLLANLASGLTSVIPDADLRFPGAIHPAPVLQQIQRHRIETSAASPAFFERLALYGREEGVRLPGIRRLFCGGAPVFPRLLDQMQELAPEAEVVAVYGSTEAEPIAHVSRNQIHDEDIQTMLAGHGLLAGKPVESIQLRVIPDRWGEPIGPFGADAFQDQVQPAGKVGEIVVTGEHVLKGYWQGIGDAETKFRVEDTIWHRTGDAGYVDALGRLWLLGRCSARIEDDRGILYPFSVECAVYQDPAVKRAALVQHQGKRVLAVEFYPGRTVAAEMLRQRLAWAAVDEVRPMASLPVDARHNAKVDYPRLGRVLEQQGK